MQLILNPPCVYSQTWTWMQRMIHRAHVWWVHNSRMTMDPLKTNLFSTSLGIEFFYKTLAKSLTGQESVYKCGIKWNDMRDPLPFWYGLFVFILPRLLPVLLTTDFENPIKLKIRWKDYETVFVKGQKTWYLYCKNKIFWRSSITFPVQSPISSKRAPPCTYLLAAGHVASCIDPMGRFLHQCFLMWTWKLTYPKLWFPKSIWYLRYLFVKFQRMYKGIYIYMYMYPFEQVLVPQTVW